MNQDNKKKKRIRLIRNIVVLFLSLVFVIFGSGLVYADMLLSQIHYNGLSSLAPPSGSIPLPSGGEGTSSTDEITGDPNLLGGLYHDDAITNILLLGVDDYQDNDIGRSDSMMMVSVDTRHKKLKLTSFMRDLYVAIPYHGSNKLNAAYPLGYQQGGAGAGGQLAVSTIEANFGVDIDRFVLIDNSAFDQIIDNLGGVEITLTAAEARLINQNSGDPSRNLTEGTFNLSGKQAHYYSRIRAIGDDFERTQRQRNVLTSLVNKFKTSNIGTINKALYDCLGLVQTNMTKDEVFYLAANALTYMNYPMEEHRVPEDDEYYATRVDVGSVLVPYREMCSESLIDFIFEDDRPEMTTD
ncbi:MAG: LCP family protein [Anaeromassilibacillus sp.]